MIRTVILVLTCMSLGLTAHADDDTDEMDFLDNDKAEQHRKAREADRAPASDVFLDDEDDEDGPLMTFTGQPPEVINDDPGDEEDDIEGPVIGDDEDDMDSEDPINDLSPADQASLMRPLSDNYPLALVAKSRNQITVELPVLVAQSQDDFDGQDYWVVAKVVVNGTAISEGRHLVTQSSIAPSGPTKVWFKLEAPVSAPEVDVEVQVSQRSTTNARQTPLFSRSMTVGM